MDSFFRSNPMDPKKNLRCKISEKLTYLRWRIVARMIWHSTKQVRILKLENTGQNRTIVSAMIDSADIWEFLGLFEGREVTCPSVVGSFFWSEFL